MPGMWAPRAPASEPPVMQVSLQIDAVPVFVTREKGPAFTECLSPGTDWQSTWR